MSIKIKQQYKREPQMENLEKVLCGEDVEEIASLLKSVEGKCFEKCYDYICNCFYYLPIEFTDNRSKEFVNNDPIKANKDLKVHVDGSGGDKTTQTPEKLLEIYVELWEEYLEFERKEIPKRGRQSKIMGTKYKYNLSWNSKSNIEGAVSGDTIFSFPKNNFYNEIKGYAADRYLKLLARLCYTIGNFIPVPKKGRGKLSVNSLHSYKRGYINNCFWERFDKFAYDVINNDEYKNTFGEGFITVFLEKSYLNNILLKDGEVIDLVTLKTADNGMFEDFSKQNINSYIINVCAFIIARGNAMLKRDRRQ